jgi:hypothetical protein
LAESGAPMVTAASMVDANNIERSMEIPRDFNRLAVPLHQRSLRQA